MRYPGWTNVVVDCLFECANTVAEFLEEHGALSVSILAADEQARTTVSGLFDKEFTIGDSLYQDLEPLWQNDSRFSITSEHLEDRDWVREVQQNFKPLQISDRLWIIAPWHQIEARKASQVTINPGMSFGTGQHATTRMCLEFLSELELKGCDVIDYGCGSGILAISALVLGAEFAWGVDIDPDAVVESTVNAERNGVQDRYMALVPDKVSTDVIADVVVANLFENALVHLTHQLTGLTAQSGWLALSGILTSQAERVKIHYADSFDFSLRCEGEWALLVARRKTQ